MESTGIPSNSSSDFSSKLVFRVHPPAGLKHKGTLSLSLSILFLALTLLVVYFTNALAVVFGGPPTILLAIFAYWEFKAKNDFMELTPTRFRARSTPYFPTAMAAINLDVNLAEISEVRLVTLQLGDSPFEEERARQDSVPSPSASDTPTSSSASTSPSSSSVPSSFSFSSSSKREEEIPVQWEDEENSTGDSTNWKGTSPFDSFSFFAPDIDEGEFTGGYTQHGYEKVLLFLKLTRTSKPYLLGHRIQNADVIKMAGLLLAGSKVKQGYDKFKQRFPRLADGLSRAFKTFLQED